MIGLISEIANSWMGLLDRESSEKKKGVFTRRIQKTGHARREVKVMSHMTAHRLIELS